MVVDPCTSRRERERGNGCVVAEIDPDFQHTTRRNFLPRSSPFALPLIAAADHRPGVFMSQSIAIARARRCWTPRNQHCQLDQVMNRLLSRRVDAADIFFQYARPSPGCLEDGIIKEGTTASNRCRAARDQ